MSPNCDKSRQMSSDATHAHAHRTALWTQSALTETQNLHYTLLLRTETSQRFFCKVSVKGIIFCSCVDVLAQTLLQLPAAESVRRVIEWHRRVAWLLMSRCETMKTAFFQPSYLCIHPSHDRSARCKTLSLLGTFCALFDIPALHLSSVVLCRLINQSYHVLLNRRVAAMYFCTTVQDRFPVYVAV